MGTFVTATLMDYPLNSSSIAGKSGKYENNAEDNSPVVKFKSQQN
jgi:hypothetical protein